MQDADAREIYERVLLHGRIKPEKNTSRYSSKGTYENKKHLVKSSRRIIQIRAENG